MAKEESIFDMTAEAFAEKHPDDVKAWKAQAAETATEAAQDAERQRFAALETAFPDHLAFVAAQFKSGASVEQAKVAYADVLGKELAAERKARAEAEEKAAAAQRAATFRATDKEPTEKEEQSAGKSPKTFMAAVEAHRKAHPQMSARDRMRECALTYPELFEKHRRGN